MLGCMLPSVWKCSHLARTFISQALRRQCFSRLSYSSQQYQIHSSSMKLWADLMETKIQLSNINIQISKYLTSRTYSNKTNSHDSIEDAEQLIDISVLTKDIIGKISKKDKMILSIPLAEFEDVVKVLLAGGLSPSQVEEVLMLKQSLRRQKKLKQVLEMLQTPHFTSDNIFSFLKNCPSSLTGTNQIKAAFDALRVVGLNDNQAKDVVVAEPDVITLKVKDIQNRVAELKMFLKTQDVLKMVHKTPIVLLCDLDEIESKFDYIVKEMKADPGKVVHTNIFAHSLEHIRCRHLFLSRAGFYDSSKHGRDKNPKLKAIFDSSDADFSKQFGGMSVDEYRTFCKMLSIDTIDEID